MRNWLHLSERKVKYENSLQSTGLNENDIVNPSEHSEWACYMFGTRPGDRNGFVYLPTKENVPNWFVRLMMKIFLGCTWVKERREKV